MLHIHTSAHSHARTHARRAARRGQGGRLTTLNFRPGAVTPLNLGHVSIFYQVIFPVNKQGSIESPPRKQIMSGKRYAKEGEKQTIVPTKTDSKAALIAKYSQEDFLTRFNKIAI